MKSKSTYLVVLMTFFSFINTEILFSQCEGNQTELEGIKLKYESKYKDIEKKSKEIEDNAPDPDNAAEAAIQVDFDIKMNEQHFALDLVSVTMKDKKISFGLPQITMEPKSIKFDEVYTIMVIKKTGQYPQVYCKDTWIHVGPIKTKGAPKCTTVWKDILTSVPEIHTRTVEIKTNLPQFKMATTEFITAIPEFKMVRQDFKMNLPSIIVKNVKAETKQMEKDTEELKNYSQDLIGEQKKDFATAISENFQCQRSNLLAKRDELTSSFLTSVKEIDSNIEQLNANGFDPSNLKSSDGQTINLLELKKQLAEKEKEALTSIDNAINDLNVMEKETLNKYFAA